MLAVTGGKGGVGKTTTALGVAAAAARVGRRPVVVDADLDMPNLATMADVKDEWIRQVADGVPLSAAPTTAGITVLGARGATLDDLRTVLAQLESSPRLTVLDCPAGAGSIHGIALRSATESLLVTRATHRAVVAAHKTHTFASELGAAPVGGVLTGVKQVPPFARNLNVPNIIAVPPTNCSPVSNVAADFHRGIPGWIN